MKLGTKVLMGTVFAAALGASSAYAGTIPYPNVGTPNPVTYTFTATADGPITAYFGGSGASYEEEIGLLVNGVSTGIFGLNDHSSSVGDSIVLGNVHAGDTLVFEDLILNPSSVGPWYSDPSLNSDGGNHVYSTSATAGQVYSGSPAGTYVAFEDLNFKPAGNSDYNYFDDTFVFTNVSTTPSTPGPVPGMGLVALALLALYGAVRLRRA